MVEKTRITAEEFLNLPESTAHIELIHGEMIMSPAPVPLHQRLVGRLFALSLGIIPDGEVFMAPIDVYLDDLNVVQPDVLWISAKSETIVPDQAPIHGVPDLIVEVLSPSTAKRDKSEKFKLYEQHGVREYWMLDPIAQFIEVWRLQDAKFALVGVFGADDTFTSVLFSENPIGLSSLFA